VGLDMYLIGAEQETDEPVYFGEWRKHWPLHEYLVTRFARGMEEYKRITSSALSCRRLSYNS
jgi:hypothetical protein